MASLVTTPKTSHLAPPPSQTARAPGFFARLLDAISEARQRRANRELAEILGRRGGIMGDEWEGAPAPARAQAQSRELPCFRCPR